MEKTTALTWTDQPEEVEDAIVMGEFTMDTHHKNSATIRAEIRTKPSVDQHPWYYLSVGTLFGSETVKCRDAALLLEVLCNLGRKGAELPDGVETVVNTKREAK